MRLCQKPGTATAEEEARERASFKPHLWVLGEREIPSPIFVAAIFGQDRFRRVPLPKGVVALPDDQQEAVIRRRAVHHFLMNKGTAGPFGTITGYVYRRTPDDGWTLSASGEVLDRTAGRVAIGKAELFLEQTPVCDLINWKANE